MDNCMLCGSIITAPESIERGIGSECHAAVQKAVMKRFFATGGNSLYYHWIIEVEIIKELFIDTFKDTKFRKEFKKSFYKSMCDADRVSKKQLKIMNDWLFWADVDMNDVSYKIYKAKKDWLREQTKDLKVTNAEIEVARKEIRT